MKKKKPKRIEWPRRAINTFSQVELSIMTGWATRRDNPDAAALISVCVFTSALHDHERERERKKENIRSKKVPTKKLSGSRVKVSIINSGCATASGALREKICAVVQSIANANGFIYDPTGTT